MGCQAVGDQLSHRQSQQRLQRIGLPQDGSPLRSQLPGADGRFAQMRTMEVWYARLDLETILPSIKDQEAQKRLQRRVQKTETSDVLETDFPKLVSLDNGEPTIRDNPPLIYHLRDQAGPEFEATVADAFARYRESLPDERRVLLDRFQRKDLAMKVVGVGSVGTFWPSS